MHRTPCTMEQQLIAAFEATLQPDAQTIKSAERHLRDVLHAQPDTGLSLVRIVYADDGGTPLAIRQAAAVNLSTWIKERWSPFFSDFIGFPSPDSTGGPVALDVERKPAIRDALLNSLTLRETKLRGPMLKALINVASCDWPDEFSDLLPRVKVVLASAQPADDHTVEGALAFLDEWFYTSMDENSLLSITRDLFPDLEAILAGHTHRSPQLRCHCISILNQTLETLWMVKEQFPDAAKTVAQELLPKWLGHLETIIGADPAQIIASFGSFNQQAGQQLAIQAQAWQTLVTATHFATHFKPRLATLQAQALRSLTSLQAAFLHFHVTSTDEEAADMGDNLTFFATPSALAAKIIDFLGVLLQRSKSTSDPNTLSSFVPLLCAFSQITAAEEEEWLANVSAFVAAGEEDEMGALNDSMRGRSADIVGEVMGLKPAETVAALQNAVVSAHARGQEQRSASIASWWKEEEAALALIGGVAEYVVEQLEEARQGGVVAPTFDLEHVFATSVMPYMSKGTPFFLYGRCFVFASQFASILPMHLAVSFLEAAVHAMEETSDDEGDAIVKLSAVRCVRNFHRHLADEIVRPYTARILARLAPLLLNASEDVLVLIVETLQAVAVQRQTDAGNVPAQLYSEMADAAIKAWAKEAMDRVLQSAIEDLLEAFAGQPSTEAAVSTLQGAIPLLAQLLQHDAQSSTNGDAAKYRSAVVTEGALEFAAALVRGAKADVLSRANFVGLFFPPLFATLASMEDDRDVLHNSAILLSAMIAKLPGPSLAWHDAQGTSAVQHILRLIAKMISPDDSSESGGLAVGDLLTTMLRKQPQSLSADLPDICRALVARLATSSSTSLIQSLVVPLAFLMKDHLDVVLSLLVDYKVVVREDGKPTAPRPALEVLMRKWTEFAPSVQGFWNARVSALGLCAVFNARSGVPGVAETIDGIIVDGDLLPDDVNIIKTRSRARTMPDRYTQVPVPAKMIKVLLGELREATDGPPRTGGGGGGGPDADDALTDDDDDEWGDDEYGGGGSTSQKRQAFLSDMLGEDLDGDLEGLLHKHDEEQFSDDPVWNMEFRTYLVHFFRSVAQNSAAAQALSAHLNADEVAILRAQLS